MRFSLLFIVITLSFSSMSLALSSHLRYASSSIYEQKFLSDLAPLSLDVLYYDRFILTQTGLLSSTDNETDYELIFDPVFLQPGMLAQLRQLKEANPELKIMLTIGGWGFSQNFSGVFASETKRQTLLEQMQGYFSEFHVDGFFIDWRYPVFGGSADTRHSASDGENLQRFVSEYKQRFPAKLIASVVPIAPMESQNTDYQQLADDLDWIVIPTDGLHGAWDSVVFHQAPLYRGSENLQYSLESVLSNWVALDIDPSKIVLCAPATVNLWFNTKGLNQPFKMLGDQPYRVSLSQAGLHSNEYQWDDQAKAAYAYRAETQTFYSFETAKSLQYKSYYATLGGFGGLLISENYHLDDQRLNAMIQANQRPYWWVQIWHGWQIIKQGPDTLTLILTTALIALFSVGIVAWWLYRKQQWLKQLTTFRVLIMHLRQHIALTSDLLRHTPLPQAQVSLAQIMAQLHKIALESDDIQPLEQPVLKQNLPIEHFILPFAQRYQLPLPNYEQTAELHIDLAMLWQSIEQCIAFIAPPKLEIAQHTLILSFEELSISDYLQGKIQAACTLWHRAGGLVHYQPTKLQLTLPCHITHSSQSKAAPKAILFDQVAELINKLGQSKELEEQIQLLLQCFEKMGFAAANAQVDSTTQFSYGNNQLPQQWHYQIRANQRWQISLHQQEPLAQEQQIYLNAIAGQIQLLQDLLQQIGQSPHFLLDLYEISRSKDKILYIEANRGYSIIHFAGTKKDKVIIIRLRHILNYFDQHKLIQVHRSTLVNPARIKAVTLINTRSAEIDLGDTKVNASAKYFSQLKAWL